MQTKVHSISIRDFIYIKTGEDEERYTCAMMEKYLEWYKELHVYQNSHHCFIIYYFRL